jgi:hypothetical protein
VALRNISQPGQIDKVSAFILEGVDEVVVVALINIQRLIERMVKSDCISLLTWTLLLFWHV